MLWKCRQGPKEVQQRHMQVQPIPNEYVNKNNLCTFYHSDFSDHFFIFVRFQVLLFGIVKKTLYCILYQGYTWVLGRSRAGGKYKNCPFLASKITSLGLLRSVLRTESLKLRCSSPHSTVIVL